MKDRKKILELFEQQKEYTDKRISEGIEKYRKGKIFWAVYKCGGDERCFGAASKSLFCSNL